MFDILLFDIDDTLLDFHKAEQLAFKAVCDQYNITYNDEFYVLKDFNSYIQAQDKINDLYKNKYKWQEICGVNIAHSGVFSSDRTIQQYATGIWGSELMYKNL